MAAPSTKQKISGHGDAPVFRLDESTLSAASGYTCVDYAVEGERLTRSGDYAKGIQYLERALSAGTDDLRMLSAIYSQLGNAYFNVQDYNKALEYHRHDLTLARTLSDKLGEAHASGNLGNTLKWLSKYEEAILCCKRHLDISRELGDKSCELRALYNLGAAYQAHGKHFGHLVSGNPGQFPAEGRAALNKAVEYFQLHLALAKETADRMSEGRSCGNLGNTFYLLGDFVKAIEYHEMRLKIAKEFGDKPATKRAYTNLGNAHVFLGQFEAALDYYRKALAISAELKDRPLEAQCYYSLGNTCTLLHDHEQAIGHHLKHLTIARELKDVVGQARGCWSLGNAHTAIGQHARALYFVKLHSLLSSEIGDQSGVQTAQQSVADIEQLVGPGVAPDSSTDPHPVDLSSPHVLNSFRVPGANRHHPSNYSEMWTDDLSSMSGSQRGQDSVSLTDVQLGHGRRQPRGHLNEDFLDHLMRWQSQRMDDQRCDSVAISDKENRPRATDGVTRDQNVSMRDASVSTDRSLLRKSSRRRSQRVSGYFKDQVTKMRRRSTLMNHSFSLRR